MLGIVAHQELTQVDARVESLPNAGVKDVLLFNDASDLTRELFKGRDKHWVQFLREVDIVVLFAVGQLNDLSLELEERLNEGNLEVIGEEIHVFLVVLLIHLITHITGFNLLKNKRLAIQFNNSL